MAELNEPQARAVACDSGPLLVFAGAGSGKTRVITYRVARLLAEKRVPPYRILAVTFTNKAAGEMRERLVKLAGAEVVRDLWVGTFHATCAKLLRRYHTEVGLGRDYVIYDDSDQKAVMNRVLKAMNLDPKVYPPRAILSRIHRLKRDAIRPSEVKTNRVFDSAHVEAFERYQAALTTANAVDFEDLIVHVMRIAEDTSSTAGDELRSKFRYVLVDEFQDTNATQYRLVRALAAREQNLCVVGDDDQSIYGWRGADVRNIRGFRHDFPSAMTVKLEQNYRSTANIVRAALGIIEQARDREPKTLWTASELGDVVEVRMLGDEREEAAFVVRTIQKERARGVEASEVAVFYRVHAQSRVIEEALRAANVPYQVVGGMKFFERAEVKNLLAYLRLIDNPKSDADLLRIINFPARGIGDKTVQKLLDIAGMRGGPVYDAIVRTAEIGGLGAAAQKKLLAFRDLCERLRTAAPTCTPSELAALVLGETGYEEALRAEDNAESDARLENLAELVGSIAEFEESAPDSGEPPTLAAYLERVSLVADVDMMKDQPVVSLMTVHSAKGLEFTTVLLTGMEEEIFPYRGIEASDAEELEEERRLAYVAVTRARERLFVTSATVRTIFGQTRYQTPSRFLAALPDDVVRYEGLAQRSRAPSPARTRPAGERWVEPEAADAARDETYDEDSSAVRPGDSVEHARFGRGVVQSVEPPYIVGKFPGWGVRKVHADYVQMR